MNHQITPPDEDGTWESDPVWKLLNQAPAPPASARFADDVVRLARLTPAPRSWWQTLLAPAPLAGLTAATAAIAIAVISLTNLQQEPSAQVTTASASIEEIAETEILLAAVDHLENFSDTELASLVGF